MAVRLLEMHRILKPTGSIYLHCDPTASHYLKAVMDAIFGWKQFRNEIVWCYKSGGASKKTFAKKHDIIPPPYKIQFLHLQPAEREKLHGRWIRNRQQKREALHRRKSQSIRTHTLVNLKDWWEIPMIATSNKSERTGFPTKSHCLYMSGWSAQARTRATSSLTPSLAVPQRSSPPSGSSVSGSASISGITRRRSSCSGWNTKG